MGSSETYTSISQNKKSPVATKKIALRDVQNDNRNCMHFHPESSRALGINTSNGSKLSGNKRSNPMCSQNSVIHQSLKGVGVNEHIISSTLEADAKPSKKRALGCYTFNAPTFSSIPVASPMTFSPVRSLLPIFLEKTGNVMAVAGSNLRSITPQPEMVRSVIYNEIIDEQRNVGLLNLQKLLEQLDECDKKCYIELLHGLPPSELSRLAIQLEKRSMHLSVEEGKEIQRMKSLNIFGNLSDI